MTDPHLILWPMCAMAGLTFVVLSLIPIRRFRAGRQGLVKVDDFRLGESENVPDYVALANRNYMNLLELPVLFYASCLALLALGASTSLTPVIAWGYVATRTLHSVIHLTSNNVIHRLTAFAVSNGILAVLWVQVVNVAFANSTS